MVWMVSWWFYFDYLCSEGQRVAQFLVNKFGGCKRLASAPRPTRWSISQVIGGQNPKVRNQVIGGQNLKVNFSSYYGEVLGRGQFSS